MKLISDSFKEGERIPSQFAFGKWNPESKIELAENMNPHLQWTQAPEGTKSFAVLCVDPDVPSQPDDVNQEGKTVPASLARVDFFHWVLFGLKANRTHIAEGEMSSEVTARGKEGPNCGEAFHGLNNYTQWFAGDADMEGEYYGYDGPCPPWNDEIIHHYRFTVYALDIETLSINGTVDGPAVLKAMEGHILEEASITGIYAINPEAK